jgi:hypothetical protein
VVNQGGNSSNDIIINSLFGPGAVIGNIEQVASSYCSTGSQMYVWVFNSNSTGTATEWGIFSSTTWAFPNDLGQQTMSSFDVDSVIRGSTTGGTTTGDKLMLSSVAVVPEPSSSLLVLTTGLITLRRRRR